MAGDVKIVGTLDLPDWRVAQGAMNVWEELVYKPWEQAMKEKGATKVVAIDDTLSQVRVFTAVRETAGGGENLGE